MLPVLPCTTQLTDCSPLSVLRVNVSCGQAERRVLLTGLHAVADIYCECCKTTLGWKYVSSGPSRVSTAAGRRCGLLWSAPDGTRWNGVLVEWVHSEMSLFVTKGQGTKVSRSQVDGGSVTLYCTLLSLCCCLSSLFCMLRVTLPSHVCCTVWPLAP